MDRMSRVACTMEVCGRCCEHAELETNCGGGDEKGDEAGALSVATKLDGWE